jgi:hypothetical protein
MYLEDFEQELDFNDYVDHTDGDILDLSDDDGVEMNFKSAGTTLPSDFEKEDTSAFNHVTQGPEQFEPVVEVKKPVKVEVKKPVKVEGKRSKSDIAKEIYERELKKGPVVRKEIIKLFKSEAMLTDAGAATYYNIIHKQHTS